MAGGAWYLYQQPFYPYPAIISSDAEIDGVEPGATANLGFGGFGAVAYDPHTGARGWSVHQPLDLAEQAALSACGTAGCAVVIRIGTGKCAAVAGVEGQFIIGAATRDDPDEARLAAVASCQQRASGDCIVQFSDCNR